MTFTPITRLFIANRGEIARRIATTAKRLGVEVVVVTDRATPPEYLIGLVDQFAFVDEERTQLYLDGDRMIALARQHGCNGLHPGFGFLSENAQFARKVIDAGLIWVGPSPTSIDAMASKARARIIAMENKFPCIEALDGFVVKDEVEATSVVQAFGRKVGYPVLVKAALGGGGKGMRLVHKDEDVRDALVRASSEAVSSFGDPNLVVEKYLGSPRHVEVQVLGDQHGTIVTVGDRDCSIQRRHQKVLEEAPAPCLTSETRAAIHDAARRLAAGVKYFSAGTVELLVDGSESEMSSGLQRFYFLEMNTRLQVEHPVSEEVFGVDLVEWQLRVAAGERLPESFKTLSAKGHSIEARIYAEDPLKGYLPMPGPLRALRPDLGTGMRWEIGLDNVDEVTTHFDPMIAKAIASGPDRLAALDRLADSLERSMLCSGASNIPLIIATAREKAFRRGGVTTHYLKDKAAELEAAMLALRSKWEKLAESVHQQLKAGARTASALQPGAASASMAGSRSAAILATTQNAFGGISLSSRTNESTAVGIRWGRETSETLDKPGCSVRTGYGYAPTGNQSGTQGFHYVIVKTPAAIERWVVIAGQNFMWVEARDTGLAGGSVAAAGAGGDVTAPLPGKLISVHVAPGDVVKLGQTLFVMESMKMELEVKASKAGTIERVLVAAGQIVQQGITLAVWQNADQHPQKV